MREGEPEDEVESFSLGGSDCGLVAGLQRPNQELRLKGNERCRLIIDEGGENRFTDLVVMQLLLRGGAWWWWWWFTVARKGEGQDAIFSVCLRSC